jgi:hypothetical protein
VSSAFDYRGIPFQGGRVDAAADGLEERAHRRSEPLGSPDNLVETLPGDPGAQARPGLLPAC